MMGWPMGLEPTATGITIQDSTIELRPPLKTCELPVVRQFSVYTTNCIKYLIRKASLVYTCAPDRRNHNRVTGEVKAFRFNRLPSV